MGTPVRYPFGVSTNVKDRVLGSFPLPSPFTSASNPSMGVAVYENDFTKSVAEYTVTGTSSTVALGTALGGTAVITPGGTTTATAAYGPRSVGFVAGQKLWFAARVAASAVAGNVALYVGLRIGSGTTDGLWFAKPAASTSVKLVSTVSSTATDLLTGLGTMVAATPMVFGMYYDGLDLLAFIDGELVGRVAAPTLGTTIDDAVMGPVFQITPVATETLTVDYVLAACEVERG